MDFSEELAHLREEHLLRNIVPYEDDGAYVTVDDRRLLNCASNDYLGLAHDGRVIAAAQAALVRDGVGSGASRLICGTRPAHRELEERIARFKRREAALVFPTGYMANVGIITAMCGADDAIIIDKLSHASIIDACRMSGATVRVFPHKKYDRCAALAANSAGARRVLIVTDAVFSMDGDLADLPALVAIKKRYINVMLMIDEAHAIGVFGDGGRGLAEASGVAADIDVIMGTLSKAVGVMGGYVAASRDCIDYIVNKARPFIFTTAQPAALCAAATTAIDIIEHDEALRARLWQNIRRVGEKLIAAKVIARAESSILPVIVGDSAEALQCSAALRDAGFLVPAVRFPTVAKNKARLRISLSAAHESGDLDRMCEAVVRISKDVRRGT